MYFGWIQLVTNALVCWKERDSNNIPYCLYYNYAVLKGTG
jgi:hypothetical protein